MKIKALMAALALTTVVSVAAKKDVALLDTNRLVLETQRGKELQAAVEEQARVMQERQQALSADLQARSEALQKQAKIMSADAYQEEVSTLRLVEAQAQRELKGMQEDLQYFAQQKQQQLQREMLSLASGMCQEEEWGVLLDKSNPVVIASSDDCDVTDKVIEKADERHQQAIESAARLSEE